MMKRIFALLITVALVLANPGSFSAVANAGSDVIPPVLIGYVIDNDVYDVGDVLSVLVQATDDASGIDLKRSSVFFSSVNRGFSAAFEEGSNANTYTAKATLSKDYFPTGKYHITSIILVDLQNNSKTYSINDGTLSPFEFTINNTLRTDWSGPELVGLTMTQGIMKAGDKINFEITASNPAGLDSGIIVIGRDNNQYWYPQINLAPVAGTNDKLFGSMAVPPDMPAGEYQIYSVVLTDTLENNNDYQSWSNLPERFRFRFTVENAVVQPPAGKFMLTNISISPQTVRQGEPVKITVSLDPKGNQLGKRCNVFIGKSSDGTGLAGRIGYGLEKVEEGVYSGSVVLPVNWSAGEYSVSEIDVEDKIGATSSYPDLPDWYKGANGAFIPQKFMVTSIYEGTENISIPVNGTFDAMAGVKAANSAEGDMTDNIIVSGDVDTSKVGVYLVKYVVESKLYKSMYGGTTPLNYYDFRWVGVSEAPLPTNPASGDPLVVTNDSVAIDPNGSDVTINRDGTNVSGTSSVTQQGNYTIAFSAAPGMVSAAPPAAKDGPKNRAKFIIDRKGPGILTNLNGAIPRNIKITADVTDPSGVAVTKWQPGEVSLAVARKLGVVFRGSFTVAKYGKYTVYAKDRLGNESIRCVKILYVKAKAIKLSSSKLSLVAGNARQFQAYISPANATFKGILWTSSNHAVAKVDKTGKVTAIKAGKAVITARSVDNGITARCTVTVSKPILASKVIIHGSAIIKKYGSYKFTATISPSNATNKAISWSSSNPLIASVDQNGMVFARKTGIVTITAKAANGKYATYRTTVIN